MKYSLTSFSQAVLVPLAITFPFSVTANTDTNNDSLVDLDVSGFARVVVGRLDEHYATFNGYDDGISASQESLVGIQADLKLPGKFTLSGQFVEHTGDYKESGVEWLYLSYRPTSNIQIKAGKQRTPFFEYSDVINVGYAYPWITPSIQVYSPYLFSYFEGAHARIDIPHRTLGLAFETYFGSFDDKYFVADSEINTDVDNMRGYIGTLSYDNWSFRASHHKGDIDSKLDFLDGFRQTLLDFGFEQNASYLVDKGRANFNQFSINYEALDYFIKSEWTYMNADFVIVPQIKSYYVSGGYRLPPYTFHFTIANSNTSYRHTENEIRTGRGNAEIDNISATFDSYIASLQEDDLRSYRLGVRYDWREDIAFKFDFTWLNGHHGTRAYFSVTDRQNFDRHSTLAQFAVEYVF